MSCVTPRLASASALTAVDDADGAAGNPYAARLRAAGLRATSARIAVLRVAPELIDAHGGLWPAQLSQACAGIGYTLHPTVFPRLLRDLVAAGVLAAAHVRR